MRFYVAKRNHPISNLKSEQFDSCSTNPTQFNELNFSIPHSIFFSFIDRPSRAPIQITVAQDMRAGRDPKLEQSVNDAYQAMVSYYFHRSEDGEKFVSTVNHLVEDMGLRELPAIDYHRARKIGLDKIPGLNIQQNWKDQSWTGSWVAPKTDYSRKPFDKSYGDLNGNLEKNNDSFRLARTNSWNGPTVTPKSRPRRHSWNTGDTFRDDRERRNGKAFKEHSAGKRRGGSQNKGQFVKLGYEKDPLKQSRKITSRNNQKGVFKRWEAPGEWSLKGE